MQKAFRGKLWAAFDMEQFARRMLERFTTKKAWARSVLADGRWQHETPHKEELELVRHCNDLRFAGVLMRRACYAEKSDDWKNSLDEFLGNDILSIWVIAKVKEIYSEVEQRDEGRRSIAQDILWKSTEFQRRIIAPVGGQGAGTLSCVCLIAADARLKTTFGGSPRCMVRGSAAGGVQHVDASTIGGPRTESQSYKVTRTAEMQKCFGRTRHRKECVTT